MIDGPQYLPVFGQYLSSTAVLRVLLASMATDCDCILPAQDAVSLWPSRAWTTGSQLVACPRDSATISDSLSALLYGNCGGSGSPALRLSSASLATRPCHCVCALHLGRRSQNLILSEVPTSPLSFFSFQHEDIGTAEHLLESRRTGLASVSSSLRAQEWLSWLAWGISYKLLFVMCIFFG